MELIHLGERAKITGDRARDLYGLLAHQTPQMRDLDGLTRIAYEQLASLLNRPLMHAHHAQLADVWIDRDLEDVGDDMFVWVRGDFHSLGTLRAKREGALEERGRVALRRIGHEPLEDRQQLGDSRTGLRRDETHRHEVP